MYNKETADNITRYGQSFILSIERERLIDDLLFNEGDTIILTLADEEGIIIKKIENILTSYDVRITKGGIFNQVGDVINILSGQIKDVID
jgi:hypothetical protein